MRNLLAPYLWSLIFALSTALAGAVMWIMLQAQWLAQAEAERDALQNRIDTINVSREIDNAIRSLDDDAFGADIDDRLSGND